MAKRQVPKYMATQTTGDARICRTLTDGDSPVWNNELFGFMVLDDFSSWRRKYFVKEGLAHYAKEEKYADKRGIERVRRTRYVGRTSTRSDKRRQDCLWRVVSTLNLCMQDLGMKVWIQLWTSTRRKSLRMKRKQPTLWVSRFLVNTIFCIALVDVRYRSFWGNCLGGIPRIRNRYQDIFVCQNIF